jgi:hypothetical protein
MEYAKLIAVTGLPGLYELISSRNDGAIIRSLDDNKTQFVANRVHSFSQLEGIEVYTQNDNVNLADVFHAMEKATDALPDAKDNTAVVNYFKKVFPEMDFDRVYASDQKKMVKWFEALKKHKVEIKLSETPEEDEEDEVKEAEPATEEKKKGK